MIREGWSLVLMLLIALVALPLEAPARAERLEDPQLRERFSRLTDELRCPKCQNETIAESGAPISADMRERVRKLLKEGHSDEAIVDEMVVRFGDFVRYRPPLEPRTWVLWFGPFVAIAVGIGVVVILALRARGREQGDGDVRLSGEERRRAEQWLRDD
mgnify:CR=1 FL=1